MIEVTIIADSVSAIDGSRITTFEIEYPRFIHGELMTHRLFSRNAASSRAIPIDKMIELVETNPAKPVHWGLNKAGMQAAEEHSHIPTCVYTWQKAAERAVKSARELQALGLHKQIVNRVLEPFQVMKTIVTATEFDNFFWLRCHADAQPEIKELAELMYSEYMKSTPNILEAGEWHLPYVDLETSGLSLEEAQKISASCCAQVSYRRLDDSLDKALKIYDQLVTMVPVHASPMEHLATPIPKYSDWELDPLGSMRDDPLWPNGVTHTDKQGKNWSGNFKGWVQYRQLIDGNTCWEFEGG